MEIGYSHEFYFTLLRDSFRRSGLEFLRTRKAGYNGRFKGKLQASIQYEMVKETISVTDLARISNEEISQLAEELVPGFREQRNGHEKTAVGQEKTQIESSLMLLKKAASIELETEIKDSNILITKAYGLNKY